MHLLEPFLQTLRIKKVIPFIHANQLVVDIGCGSPPKLLYQLKDRISYGIGIDEVGIYQKKGNIETFNNRINKEIKVESSSVDRVTMLAVLEHLKHPAEIIKETYRILKSGGELLVTVPTPKSKPVLEAFAKIGLVRSEMIDQHENYFSKADLKQMCEAAGFSKVEIADFEFGFNTFLRGIK